MSSPYFSGTPKTTTVSFGTANTNRDGSGTLATLITAGASGSMVNGVVVKGTGTTTAGMIRVFHYDGSNNRLVGEVIVTAITVGAAVEAWKGVWAPEFPMFIPSGGLLKLSTHNAETFHAVSSHGDL